MVSPDGGRFTRDLLPLLTNQTEVRLENGYKSVSLDSPSPGSCYAMLAATNICPDQEELLVAAKAVYRREENVITIVPSFHNYQDIRTLFSVASRQTFRFAVPGDAWRAEIRVSKCETTGGCPVLLSSSPLVIPSSSASNISCLGRATDQCSLALDTMADSDHFVTVTNLASSPLTLAITVHLLGCRDEMFSEGAMLVNSINTAVVCGQPTKRPLKILFQPSAGQSLLAQCGRTHRLTRRSEGRAGSSWSLPGSLGDQQVLHLGTSTGNNNTDTLSFTIDQEDVGGTLNIQLAILTLGAPNEVRDVVGCLSRGYRDLPRDNGSQYVCGPDSRLVVVTRSGIHREMKYERLVVLHPAQGSWHLSLLPHCSMAGQGRLSLCSSRAVTAVISVRSGQCPADCSSHGDCRQVSSPGLPLLAACSCQAGYRGPACSDGTTAQSDYTQLTVRLILTITNLALVPAIMLSLYRRHYTESAVYWCQLVAGCLHHASQGQGVSPLLQYSQSLTQLLSIWVTILAMAHLNNNLRSILHITAGLVLATINHFDITMVRLCNFATL